MLFDPSSRFVRDRSQRAARKHGLSRWFYIVVLTMCLTSWLFTDVAGNMSMASAAAFQPTKLPVPGVSYTLQQFLKQGKPYKASDKPLVLPNNSHTSPPVTNAAKASKGISLPSSEPPTMKVARQQIEASFIHASVASASNTAGRIESIPPLHVVGSDVSGVRLEVIVPAGALDLSHATISGGKLPIGVLTLSLAQLSGHFAGATSELGSFQVQIHDGQGRLLHGIRVRIPLTFIYHYQPNELSNLSLNPSQIYMTWPDLIVADKATHQSAVGTVVPMQNNPRASTLTARSTVLDAGALALGVSTNPIQAPPKPHMASVQGNAGQLTYSYPLTVAPGPQGTVPKLAANYSSGDTNQRHSPTSPSDSVGDGWSLNMGAISAEKYANGTTWYSISGVDNVSDRLVPDTNGDDWRTEHLTNMKIQKITANGQPCFQVWDTSGTEYEFGCTTDSLQYESDADNDRQNYRWDLDKVIPANEGPGTNSRVMHLSYVQDTESENGHTSVRDAALKQITYGTDANRAGTVDFFYKGPTTYIQNGVEWIDNYGNNENGCVPPDGITTQQRCDDPLDRTNGLPDPPVMSTLSLQTIKTYVGDDSSSSHLDYSYSFSYRDTPFSKCTDAVSQSPTYCAGDHLLTNITPTVYQNSTGHQLPGVTFGYGNNLKDSYDDTTHTVGGKAYHVETHWNYLTSYHDHGNGVGASNITYATAYNNSSGTPHTSDGDNRYDALFCDWHATQCTQTPFSPTDQKMWAVQVVRSITATGTDSSASSLAPATTTYDYWLQKTTGTCPADSTGMNDCVGDGWIPNGDSSWQDYYHGEFKGFGTVLSTSASGDLTVHKYAATEGWNSPESDSTNYLSGSLLEEDVYQGSVIADSKLLQKTVNTYAGMNGTHTSCSSKYDIAPYDACEVILLSSRNTLYEQTGSSNANAPWVQHDDTYDDYTSSAGLGDYHQPPATGSYHNLLKEVTSSSNASTTTQNHTYYTTDTTVNGIVYYNVDKVAHSELVDANNHKWKCEDTTYDEGVASGVPRPAAGWPTTTKTYSDCTNPGATAITTYTGYDINGNEVAAVDGNGVATPSLYSSAGCTLTTAPAFFTASSNWSASHYTECKKYDSSSALETDTWNALGQHDQTDYDTTQGLLPITKADVNGQVTTTNYSYDSSGNHIVQVSQPGEVNGYTSLSILKSACTDSSALPCMEIDTHTSLYSSAVTKIFYDNQGRRVETIAPAADASHNTVTFITYNDQANTVFTSLPFVVPARSTWLDPNGVTDVTGATPGGTSTTLDAVGSTLSLTDPLSHVSRTVYGLGTSGVSGDNNTYATTTGIDANNHVTLTYSDALNRTIYAVDNSGVSGGTLTANRRKAFQYNALDNPTSVVVSDLSPQIGQTVTSVTTTNQYDDLGRLTSLNDPDRGNHTYSYDANGNMLTDVSGTRLLGYSYDLLGRLGCKQDSVPTPDVHGACSSNTNPFVINTYDADPSGVTWSGATYPVGQLTQSVAITYYPGPDYAQGKVTENTQYDQRGQAITQRMGMGVAGGTSIVFPTFSQYQKTTSYNDASQPLMTQTTVDGQPGFTFSQAYDSTTGVQVGLSNTATGVSSLVGLNYNTQGLLGDIQFKDTSGAQVADQHLQYDGNQRPAGAATTWQSDGSTIASDAVSYDNVGNVISRASTLAAVPGVSGSGGNEVQNFCYDEQNRLVWGSNSVAATPTSGQSCGNTSLQGQGTLGGSYTSNYVYTHLGQLWQGPLNGSGTQEQYLYCNSGQPHQVTALSPVSGSPTCAAPGITDYKSSYDSWGNVTSRTYPATTVGSPVYDGQDHMVRWDGTTAANSQGEWYLYDAAGNRVMRRSASTTSGGNPATSPSTITVYAFGLEEHVYQYSGSGSSATNTNNTYYYSVAGHLIGTVSGTSTLSTNFLLTDLLGSVVAAISNTAGSATVLGNQVYGPYGNKRYEAGSVGTAKGFTGQYADDLTGLDYYIARYYDPVASGFLSADTEQGNTQGMDPYSYVEANPETKSDPTGHWGFAFSAAAAAACFFAAVEVGAEITGGALLVVSAPAVVPIALGVIAVGLLIGIGYQMYQAHQRDQVVQSSSPPAPPVILPAHPPLVVPPYQPPISTGSAHPSPPAPLRPPAAGPSGSTALTHPIVHVAPSHLALSSSHFPAGFVNNTDTLQHSPGFNYSGYLKDHFDRHGAEVGATTEAEYLSKAQNFLGGAPGNGVAQRKIENLYRRYNPLTGEYGIVNARGIIVTYFNIAHKPDPWGYFLR